MHGGRVRTRVLAMGVAAVVWLGAAGPVAAAQEPPPYTLTVAPDEAIAVGDTVTLTATGITHPPGYPGRVVVACPNDVAPEPPPGDIYYYMRCWQLYEVPIGRGDFAVDVTVRSPEWAYLGLVDLGYPQYTRVVPIDVPDPAGPVIDVRLADDTLAEGDVPAPGGLVWPAAPLSFRRCVAVPADPLDPAAVDAACRPAAAGPGTQEDGSFAAIRLFNSTDSRVRVGDVGLWVGGAPAGEPRSVFLPYTVRPASVTVTPADGLAVNQVVRVDAAGFPPEVFRLYPCAGGVLADGRVVVHEVVAHCAPAAAHGHIADPDAPGSYEYQVTERIVVGGGSSAGPRDVDCGAAPGACALVVTRDQDYFGDDWRPSAGAPIALGDGPALPLLVPAAAEVLEGDDGTVTAQVPVALSAPSAAPVTVRYATFDQLRYNWSAALWLGDYVGTDGTLTFAPGETLRTIAVEVRGDTARELDEMVFVGLATPTGAGLGGYAGIGGVVVRNDD